MSDSVDYVKPLCDRLRVVLADAEEVRDNWISLRDKYARLIDLRNESGVLDESDALMKGFDNALQGVFDSCELVDMCIDLIDELEVRAGIC